MPIEIERKFLVKNTEVLQGQKGERFRQGYIAADGVTVRVRTAGDRGYLTLKKRAKGHTIGRYEFEYSIPLQDARQMLDLFCSPEQIDKTRYLIPHQGKTWEVDVFHGANQGLMLAEIELSAEDESFDLPKWAEVEVTDDPRYYNAYLATCPFSSWNGK